LSFLFFDYTRTALVTRRGGGGALFRTGVILTDRVRRFADSAYNSRIDVTGLPKESEQMTEDEKEKAMAAAAAGAGAGVGGMGGATAGVLALAARGIATGLTAGMVIGVGAAAGGALAYGLYRALKTKKQPATKKPPARKA
jgi:hypothetical protein